MKSIYDTLLSGGFMKTIYVSAAAIIEDKKVLITQRIGGDFHGLWEFPGGKIENNESKENAVIREIKEELDCEIKPIKDLITIEYTYPNFHLVMTLFISELIKGKPTLLEHNALKWVSANELDNVNWLEADIEIIPVLKDYLLTS